MKSVLISIQPKWCELIASGKKTIEVRKTAPKLETSFKCYLYETKGKQVLHFDGCDVTYYGRGKVIGEFVCDSIEEYPFDWVTFTAWGVKHFNVSETALKNACLTRREIDEYGGSSYYRKQQYLYGWHISDLKIYDKPKELGEFYKVGKKEACIYGKRTCLYSRITDFCKRCEFELTRPPQAWCYVEG